MIYQLDKIMQDVRICLDQNMTSDALLESGDIDTLALDDIIRSKIVESVDIVHREAPFYLLECGHNFGDGVYWGELESGWVLLPADFLRLVVFEMDDWERAVYTAITPDDPDYAKQRSRFKGIRGTAQRPVCAIAIRPEGRVLEFYSCKSRDAHVSRAMYLPHAMIDKSGGIDISERCYQSVVYIAAGLTLQTCGETDKAGLLSDVGRSLLS